MGMSACNIALQQTIWNDSSIERFFLHMNLRNARVPYVLAKPLVLIMKSIG